MGVLGSRLNCLGDFSQRHPAFCIGGAFFFGAWLSLTHNLLMGLPFLACFCFGLKRGLLLFSLFCSVFFATNNRVKIPVSPGNYEGTLLAEVCDRRIEERYGRIQWNMQVFIHEFSSLEQTVRGVMVSVISSESVPGGMVFSVPARLVVDQKIRLYPKWPALIKRGKTWSLVEWRVRLRRSLEMLFAKLFANVDIRELAGASSFGLYRNKEIQLSVHNIGADHLLAISGFHFGIIAALAVFCSGYVTRKSQAFFSAFVLLFYFVCIGPLYSVVRSLVSAILLIGASLLAKKTSGLNSVGVGLIVLILFDPSCVVHVGFQLSFLATIVIVMYSEIVQKGLVALFPKRGVEQFAAFSFVEQALVGVLHMMVPVLSIVLPVWLGISVYQLCFLKDLPIFGLLYNLFVPALFALAIPIVVLAVCCSPVLWIAHLWTALASIIFRVILSILSSAPEGGVVAGESISPIYGHLFFILVIGGGVFLEKSQKEKVEWKACL